MIILRRRPAAGQRFAPSDLGVKIASWEDKLSAAMHRAGCSLLSLHCSTGARANDQIERDGGFTIALELTAQIAFVFIWSAM
jgi:hypothetical protein